MQAFKWGKQYVTTLDTVDAEHRRLVDILNAYGEALTEDDVDAEKIERVFGELAEYAQTHFANEERLMEESRVDPRHQQLHHEEHEQFFAEVVAQKGLVSRGTLNPVSLLDFLTSWLAYHILGSDQDMARQILAIRRGQAPEAAYEAEELGVAASTQPLLVALHGLFEQVRHRNRQLLELNADLERRVAQRTQALVEANLELERMAMSDVLTGLPNRRHGLRHLRMLWRETGQRPLLACLMVDADGFKRINDTYGHDAGDLVLKTLAHALEHTVRTDDMVCRLGGDEFLVICPQTHLAGASILAEKLREVVGAMRVQAGEGYWRGSISVGVAERNDEMLDVEDLLKAADEGVYLAKAAGRNCVRTAQS